MIYTGLYFSAISVSQDIAVRKSIRKSVLEQSSLLDSIGSAQMERELQTRVLTVAKKASDIMTKETGVEAPMTEDDMKDYMQVVMKELQTKR
jgi:secreted trypsin-like serine protease